MAGKVTKSGTVAAKRKALEAAQEQPLEPPEGVRLTKAERRIFDQLAEGTLAEERTLALAHLLARCAQMMERAKVFEQAAKKQPFVVAQSGVYAGQPIPNPAISAKLALERQIGSSLRQAGLTLHAAAHRAATNNPHSRAEQEAKEAAKETAPYAHLLGGNVKPIKRA
ncbi:hypothetical protein [Qipengyuania gaetbuli]|uniref:hypothetical protein n=1 Tax=Qipengyuania gaetbuli TaxID=266952 RepID=UPI001CFE725A|nr:hypothetical protein [Qipengyuania gaetbuli]